MQNMHKSTHDRPLTGVCPLADPQGQGMRGLVNIYVLYMLHYSYTEPLSIVYGMWYLISDLTFFCAQKPSSNF